MKLCRWWGSAVRQCHQSSCTRNNSNINSSNINNSNINSNSQQRIVLKSASTDVFTNLGKALQSLNTSYLPLVLPAKLNGAKINL
jgi:hypothetical protein